MASGSQGGKGKKTQRRKRTITFRGPVQFAPAPAPDTIMGRVSAEDGARLRANPNLQAFVRPLVPGEFGKIRVASEVALARCTHVYVQRVDPTTVARMRVPISAERAATFVEGELFDVVQLEAELREYAEEVTDDPFLLPQESQRLTIVAAARGAYAAFRDAPHREQDHGLLQARARQLVEHQVRLWPAITNDVQEYLRLFLPAFAFGYQIGEEMLYEVPAQESARMLQNVRSMEPVTVLILLDHMLRESMQEKGVESIYELL